MSKVARPALNTYLILMLLSMAAAAAYVLSMRVEFFAQFPALRSFFALYMISAALMGTGAVALLMGRRWGFWIILIGAVAALSVEIASGFNPIKIARIPVSVLILALLLRWNWGVLR